MNFREVYLRKKFWIQDFLHGGNMWKSYKDVMHIFNNQDIGGVNGKNIFRIFYGLPLLMSLFTNPIKAVL